MQCPRNPHFIYDPQSFNDVLEQTNKEAALNNKDLHKLELENVKDLLVEQLAYFRSPWDGAKL